MKNSLHCAHCDAPISTFYYKCLDNYLQVKYFEEEDESDNVFCSIYCFADSLLLTEVYLEAEHFKV